MGIDKLNKKNPPTPASSPSATSTLVEVLIHWYKYFYLFTVEVTLGELTGAAGKEKTNFVNANAIAKLIFPR